MPDARDLEKLKADLKKTQDDIARLNQKAAGIQTDIKTLDAKLAEILKATDGYDKSAIDMQQQLDDSKVAIGRKRAIAEFGIKDLKGALDKAIHDFDAALAVQAATVKTASEDAAQAAVAADEATHDLQDKQVAFAALKNQPRTLDARLKDLKALIDQAVKAEGQDDPVAMYFYLAEAATQAAGTVVSKPDDYKKQLIAAQADLEAVNTAAAKKKADADNAAAAASDRKKAYEAAGISRRGDLLKVLRAIKAPAPAPA